VAKLIGEQGNGPIDHCLARGVHEMKEGNEGVLTERKMKAAVA
jgi:hypothetical protein